MTNKSFSDWLKGMTEEMFNNDKPTVEDLPKIKVTGSLVGEDFSEHISDNISHNDLNAGDFPSSVTSSINPYYEPYYQPNYSPPFAPTSPPYTPTIYPSTGVQWWTEPVELEANIRFPSPTMEPYRITNLYLIGRESHPKGLRDVYAEVKYILPTGHFIVKIDDFEDLTVLSIDDITQCWGIYEKEAPIHNEEV